MFWGLSNYLVRGWNDFRPNRDSLADSHTLKPETGSGKSRMVAKVEV